MRPTASNTKTLAFTLSTTTNGLARLSPESTTQSASWRASRDGCSSANSARLVLPATSAADAEGKGRANAIPMQKALMAILTPPRAKAPRLRVPLRVARGCAPGTADLVAVLPHRALDGRRCCLRLDDWLRSGRSL